MDDNATNNKTIESYGYDGTIKITNVSNYIFNVKKKRQTMVGRSIEREGEIDLMTAR